MNASVLITDADNRRLRALTHRLKTQQRPRINEIAAIQHRIGSARIVSPNLIPRNVVTLNSRVCLRDLDSGKRMVLTLADPSTTRIFGNRLSVAQRRGAALLGKRVGQIVRWNQDAKARRLRIEQVVYQPEAAGNDL